MQHPYYKSRQTEGFVLLYTLWILMGGVVLFGALSHISAGRSRGSATTLEWVRMSSAAESAAHEAMFRLVSNNRTALTNSSRRELSIDGLKMRVEIVNSDGLVDLNAADDALLGKIFDSVLPLEMHGAAQKVRRIGRLRNYADLAAVEELQIPSLICLLPYVTLSSGRDSPTPEFAPERVRRVLGPNEKQDERTTLATPGSMAGNSARIDIEVMHETQPKKRRLLVDVLLTGRHDSPVSVLEWQWLPSVDSHVPLTSTCSAD